MNKKCSKICNSLLAIHQFIRWSKHGQRHQWTAEHRHTFEHQGTFRILPTFCC